eukprot:g76240.t1
MQIDHGYYKKYIAELGCSDVVEVRACADPARGKGVFAKKKIDEGDRIFEEQKLVGNLYPDEGGFSARCCSYCSRWLGSLEFQLDAFRQLQDEKSRGAKPNIKVNSEAGSVVPPGMPSLPYKPKELSTAEVVGCPRDCGLYYCSKLCRDKADSTYHALICLRVHPKLMDVFTLAPEHYFGLGVVALAQILTEAQLREKQLGGKNSAQADSETMEKKRSGLAVQLACKPYLQFTSVDWWEAGVPPPGKAQDKWVEERKVLFDKAHALLRDAFPQTLQTRFPTAFAPKLFSQICGAFELNNLSLRSLCPLFSYATHLQGMRRPQQKKAMGVIGNKLWTLLEEECGTMTSGTGLFKLACCMNHSCVPNAKVVKAQQHLDDTVSVVAKETILAGAEILISYLDIDALSSRDERQRACREYLFDCKCERCEAEKSLSEQLAAMHIPAAAAQSGSALPLRFNAPQKLDRPAAAGGQEGNAEEQQQQRAATGTSSPSGETPGATASHQDRPTPGDVAETPDQESSSAESEKAKTKKKKRKKKK